MQPTEPLMPWSLGPDHPRWTAALRDGSRVLIRPVRHDDAAAQRTFLESLPTDALPYRFRGRAHQSGEILERFDDLDYVHNLALAAVVHDDAKDRFVGIARYGTNTEGTDCECAVTVLDDWQGKGLGSVLMKHLIEVARSRGIKHMWSIDSPENLAMADLARYLGFHRSQYKDAASHVLYSLWL